MGKLSSLLWGAALGAGLMYFFDPQNGNRRKAMMRDQTTRLQNKWDEGLETAVSDLRNRVKGLLAEGISLISDEAIPDDVLDARVHSRLGFLTRHPGAIEIMVHNGVVTLSGDVLAEEQDNLVQGVRRVRGVRDVQDHLRIHQDAGNIPQLQGQGWLPGQNGAWAPSTRLLVGIGAAYLMLYGMVRGGLIGFFARMSGFVLGARSLTNMNMRQMTGMTEEGDAIHLRKGIRINVPVDQVYTLWSNFENFPRFMTNVESIRNLGGDRSHWVVRGPAGSKVEFDAIETQNIPDQLIAWQTTPNSQVKHQGQVRFTRNDPNSTQVHVEMSYTPPAGIAGAAVATLFGKDPKSQMDANLARMKSLLEEGKTTADNKTVTREEVMPVTGRGGRPGEMNSERKSNRSQGVHEGESSQHTRGTDTTGGMGASETGGETETGGPAGPMIPPGE